MYGQKADLARLAAVHYLYIQVLIYLGKISCFKNLRCSTDNLFICQLVKKQQT